MKWIAPLILLAICYVIFFAYLISSYADLPAKVATHFGIDGQPNGWMSREMCVGFSLGLGVLLPVIMVGTMAISGRIPVSFVNLPHREFWLAPERRKATSVVLLRFALWFASATVLFVTGVHWLIVRANAPGQGEHFNGVDLAVVVGGFLAATGIWVVVLLKRFSRKE